MERKVERKEEEGKGIDEEEAKRGGRKGEEEARGGRGEGGRGDTRSSLHVNIIDRRTRSFGVVGGEPDLLTRREGEGSACELLALHPIGVGPSETSQTNK